MELIHELSRCQRLLRAWLDERLRPWDLRDTDFWALWLCGRFAPDGVVQHELAAAAGVSEAQMSGLVERLRQNGLLIGCRGEPDRRRQYWRLTAAGNDLLTRLCAVLGESPTAPAMAFSRQDRGTSRAGSETDARPGGRRSAWRQVPSRGCFAPIPGG